LDSISARYDVHALDIEEILQLHRAKKEVKNERKHKTKK
jgi:hypothetical protein